MTNHRSVEWQPDVLGIVSGPIHSRAGRRPGLLIDDEGPLHVDLHRARVNDRAVNFRRVRSHAEGPRDCRWRPAAFLGGSSALLRIRRHHEGSDGT